MQILRRHFLKQVAVSSAGVLLANSVQAQSSSQGEYTSAVGYKFSADGSVKPFPGNTIICHVPQQGENSDYFDALLDVFREAQHLDSMRKITLLPPSSYHMTVFEGASEGIRKAGAWPRDVSLDAPMDECSRILSAKLQEFKLNCELPLRMKVDPSPPVDRASALTLKLLPVDEAENAKLRKVRDQLSDYLGMSSPGHAAYRFHTTLGYQIRSFDPDEESRFQILWEKWRNDIMRKSPVIHFGAPEYCIFKDMYAFHRQFYLS
ncbi:DUF1868 domain-containing protein [Phyllobacterium sp. 628]|uniref:DUF1868 domain-containing protein n=1 Tax=Phyllobacterium sp. 628 TaxID=2718938 RepID=UPI0016625246|nr:DUF1868 domain-containing protein [Phyllobacterium sp. 628]QND51307.1 DUF1868 domain-containing protein [Phyllobacterium sp. 628]